MAWAVCADSSMWNPNMSNLKTIADKVRWKVEYQDRVANGRFESRVALTPKWEHTIQLAWCEGRETEQEAHEAAAQIGLAHCERQPLTLLLGRMYPANVQILDTKALVLDECASRLGVNHVLEQPAAHALPGLTERAEVLGAGEHDAAALENEHDNHAVDGAVDEAREHGALEGAVDVVVGVEAAEVDCLAREVKVDVADDVLHLDGLDFEVHRVYVLAEEVQYVVRCVDAAEEVAAAREDHLAARE